MFNNECASFVYDVDSMIGMLGTCRDVLWPMTCFALWKIKCFCVQMASYISAVLESIFNFFLFVLVHYILPNEPPTLFPIPHEPNIGAAKAIGVALVGDVVDVGKDRQ